MNNKSIIILIILLEEYIFDIVFKTIPYLHKQKWELSINKLM